MTFFEKELHRLFDDSECISEDAVFAGKTMIAPIGEDLRAKVQFVYTNTHAKYDALRLTIINRHEGTVDSGYFVKMFKVATDVAEKLDLPIYCGEYGVIDVADTEGTLNWFKMINEAFEKLHIARAVWSYKKMDFGITDEHYAPIYDELLKLL